MSFLFIANNDSIVKCAVSMFTKTFSVRVPAFVAFFNYGSHL